jgi:glucokinase
MKDYLLGIDLGGTMIKIGLVRDGRIIASDNIKAMAGEGLAATLPYVRDAVNALVRREGINPSHLAGIGIGFPGLVDNISKRILSTNKKYDDALSTDLGQWVKENWNLPFIVENDARVAAVGEWKYGAGQGATDLVAITIGTGIGTAVIMDGKLLRGKHFQAGCLGGHIALQYNGRQCTCGNLGCAEAYGSTWSLHETIVSAPGFKQSLLSQAIDYGFKELISAATQKDELAIAIFNNCLDIWSTAIINLVHAYDPEMVIIGGGVMQSSELILPYIEQKVHEYAWCPWGKVQIKASELIGDAGILGSTYFLTNNL